MTKFIRAGLIAIMIGVGLIAISANEVTVFAQDQTVPTRTPRPGPTSPAQPSPTTDSNGGGNPPPNPTQTSESSGIATATTAAGGVVVGTVTSTPLPATGAQSGSAAGAQSGSATGAQSGSVPGTTGFDPCGAPMITVSTLTLVHTGPGNDYPVVGSLPPSDSRLIVGRAEFAPWWQVLLIAAEPQLLGWVADGRHTFSGDMASVLIVEPPLLNGVAPTPGALWQPTPPPLVCTPTATPTATPVATLTSTPTVTIAAGGNSSTGGGAAAIVVEGEGATELSSQGSGVNKPLVETNNSEVDSSGIGSSSGSPAGSGVAPLLIPLLGLALIVGGIAIGLLSRARPPAA